MNDVQVNKTKEQNSQNTIYENFFGGKLSILKVTQPGVPDKQLSQKQEKLGPIYLDIQHKRIYEAWNESFQDQVHGFIKEGENQKCISEAWIT